MSFEILRRAVRLVLPVECPGCDAYDVRWCTDCAALLQREPLRVESWAPALLHDDDRVGWPVWALGGYEGPLRDVVIAWKFGGRLDLSALVVPAMRAAVGAAAESVIGFERGLAVVPAPSSPQSLRRRGEDLVRLLGDAAADACGASRCDPVIGMRAAGAQGLIRRAGTQVGLASAGRSRNRRGSMQVRRGCDVPRRPTLLVDDVLTTGATMAELARVIDDANGGPVVGAFVLAATPRPASGALSAIG